MTIPGRHRRLALRRLVDGHRGRAPELALLDDEGVLARLPALDERARTPVGAELEALARLDLPLRLPARGLAAAAVSIADLGIEPSLAAHEHHVVSRLDDDDLVRMVGGQDRGRSDQARDEPLRHYQARSSIQAWATPCCDDMA